METIKERPILFSAPMVRAILEGRKTQTRRLVKPQPYIDKQGNFCWNGSNFGQGFNGPHIQAIASPIPSSKTKRVLCPYGKPGDRLWVRETCRADELPSGLDGVRYVADDGFREIENTPEAADLWIALNAYRGKQGATVPPIHMPRWASRISLEITAVRVERLQNISEADAMAEGIRAGVGEFEGCYFCGESMSGTTAKECYRRLWETINGPGSWGRNDWVWVVEFKRVQS